MVRVKMIKDYHEFRKGETVTVTRNDAHTLIDGGYGLLTKDLVAGEYHVGNVMHVALEVPKKRKR